MKPIAINPTTQFHILRHFKEVDSAYTKELIGKEYYYYDYAKDRMVKSIISPNDIRQALKTKGSKFNHAVFHNPTEVLEYILRAIKLEDIKWIHENSNIIGSLSTTFENNIGSGNMIPLANISLEKQAKITIVPRSELHGESSIRVKTLESDERTLTKIMCLELVETPDLPFLWITAYPINDYMINFISEDFWNEVVILNSQ